MGLLRENHGKQWPQQEGKEQYDGQSLWEGLKESSFSVTLMSGRLAITSQAPIKIVKDCGFQSVTQTSSINIT